MNALTNALIAASEEKSLSVSQSISSLEKKISSLEQKDSLSSRQLDHIYNSVSRSFDEISSLDGVTMTDSTITSSSFSGTTGTFSGLLTGADGTFSGDLTVSGTGTLSSLSVTSTTATSTFSTGGLTVGTNQFVVQQTSGYVGIGTSSPFSLLSIKGSSGAQMTIAQADTNYTQLTVDASGNLTITPSGSTITIPDDNLKVCAGDACQTTVLNSGNGNLTVENNIEIGGNYNRTCATGYVWVPGSAKFGTLPGFCVMKYEAKGATTSPPILSTATGAPIVSITQANARAACQAIGLDYHLVSEPEWMTLAENIATTPINDMDDDTGLQLSTGNSDQASPASTLAATSASDPVVSSCNLSATMENAANAYSASSCEIRGDGSYAGDDNDKGYYGTSDVWSATGYVSGGANKSQLRTHVLSNGSVVWDLAGNLREWTDAYINSAADSLTVNDYWHQWSEVTDYKTLNYARPQNPSWSGTNGTGVVFKAVNLVPIGLVRGGYWNDSAFAGVFTLMITYNMTDFGTELGFRCAR